MNAKAGIQVSTNVFQAVLYLLIALLRKNTKVFARLCTHDLASAMPVFAV